MIMTTCSRSLVALLAAVSALFIAGCASSPKSSSADTAASAPEARLAPAVTIPASAARKVVLTMTGPKSVLDAKDWADFKREWQTTFGDHARQAGIAFAFADSAPPTGSDDGTLLSVDVADYRMIGIGARIMFGIMTGNAYIDAKIRYVNLRDGSTLGEQQYNTTSSAAGGIFAKVTPQQVDQIATSVFLDFKAAK